MIIRIANVTIERFTPEHTTSLYRLVNRPDVRQGMSNSEPIAYSSHLQWVQHHLLDSDHTHLFMSVKQYQGQGVVLIKNMTAKAGELGIMVDNIASARKTLLTSKLLTGILFYAFDQLGLQRLDMRIIPNNSDSYTIAKKIGASFQYQDETYQHFVLSKQQYYSLALHQLLRRRFKPEIEMLCTQFN